MQCVADACSFGCKPNCGYFIIISCVPPNPLPPPPPPHQEGLRLRPGSQHSRSRVACDPGPVGVRLSPAVQPGPPHAHLLLSLPSASALALFSTRTKCAPGLPGRGRGWPGSHPDRCCMFSCAAPAWHSPLPPLLSSPPALFLQALT